MRPMEETTYNAIKEGKMIGDMSYAYKFKVEGLKPNLRDFPDSLVGIMQGYNDEDCLASGYVKTKDGRYMSAWFTSNKTIKIGYVSDRSFLYENYAMDTVIEITTMTNGADQIIPSLGPNPLVDLLKLDDGKILMFINDQVNTIGQIAKISCLISNSGNGDDFTFLSYVSTYDTTGVDNILGTSSGYNALCSIKIKSGRILLSTPALYYNSGFNYAVISYFFFYSDDNGATWTSAMRFGSGYALSSPYQMGQFFELPTGEVYITVNFSSASAYLLKATGDGSWYDIIDLNEVGAYKYFGSWFYDDLSDTLICFPGGNGYNYIARIPNPTPSKVENAEFEDIIHYNGLNGNQNRVYTLDYGELVMQNTYLGRSTIVSVERPEEKRSFLASSISIHKGKGGANTASIRVDNTNGVINPRNKDSELYGLLKLNNSIIINQGYGSDLVPSFTGIIDSLKLSSFPQVADISLRDNLKLALDQTVTKNGNNTIVYTKQPIEDIVTDLATLAGLTIGYIEPTGISIEKTFSWQSYADAFQFLADIASFEFLTDEEGLFHFRRDNQPDNMYVAWSFNEGVDISSLNYYEVNDNDLYVGVRVYGKNGDQVISYQAPFLDAAEFNILPQKLLKVDVTEASTVAELKKIAQRAIATMRSRTRIIEFTSVGIPHLQVGDFIQIFESSTMSADVYRLSSMNLNMNDQDFTMTCKAYYYGDSVVPEELPTTVDETQVANPTLNLIPEMTSNTTPSGVARASSTYVLYQNDYKPWNAFNSTSSDLFWDASANHGWIEYQFTEKKIVDKYMIKARQLELYNLAMPRDWTFEAFNGEKWIVLDTVSGETSWAIHEERVFKFANTTPYLKYRLNISRNNGYRRLQLEQLAMYYGAGD